MDKLLDSLLASGPLAIALLIALRHQTNQLAEARAENKALRDAYHDEIKALHGEKEKLLERVLDTLRGVNG